MNEHITNIIKLWNEKYLTSDYVGNCMYRYGSYIELKMGPPIRGRLLGFSSLEELISEYNYVFKTNISLEESKKIEKLIVLL